MDFFRIISLIILIFSAILHEIAHGYVADRLGDPTARLSGRLTLNPIKHIDPFMTILLPLMLFLGHSPVVLGGAKPVPVDEFNLRNKRKDMAIIALSGPLTNIALAIISAVAVHILRPFSSTNDIILFLLPVFALIAINNILLAFFNMVPIPPLDGSKLFALLLPEKDANTYLRLGNIGFLIILFLFAIPIDGFSLSGLLGQILVFSQSLLGI